MATVDQITRIYHVERVDLEAWIEHRWIRPTQSAEDLVFDELDEARIALICELRNDLQVGDEAMDVVLSLLDQLYATRRLVRMLNEAVTALPEPLRAEIRSRVEAVHQPPAASE